ncbi:MAG: hypothetical protein AB1728_13745, partial [Bacteroidota bacterium]
MGVIFDILGSFVVRAAIVAVMLNLMISLNEALYRKNDRMYLTEVLEAPSQVIANDLRLAGYNASKTFARAYTTDMMFYADTGNDGSVESIRFYLSGTTLYRRINSGTPFELARSVTYFNVTYYNIYGNQVSGSSVSGVKSIYIQLTIRSGNRITSVISD